MLRQNLTAPEPRHDSRRRNFRPDIEGLRAVAVLAVVLDHSGLAVHGGYVGVDVFFVISGYLITGHLFGELSEVGHVSLTRFYARRVRRILPAATVVIIATLLGAWAFIPPLEIHSTGLDAIGAAFFFINYRIAETGTNYFANPAPSPFQQYWSLAIEEQFYAVWPLLILGVTMSTRCLLSRRRALSIFLTIVVAASLSASALSTASSPSWAYFGLQTRAWELALGALIAINADTVTTALRPVADLLSWCGLAAIVVAAFVFSATTSYPGIDVALPVAGAAAVIAAGGAQRSRGAATLLGTRPFQYVGRISYSWYLWHWPILILLPLYLGHALTTTDALVGLAGSFIVASVSYALIEQPFRRNTSLVTYPGRGLLFGLTLVALSVMSAVIVMTVVTVPTASGTPTVATGSTARNVVIGTRLQALPANLSPPLAQVPHRSPYTCMSDLTADSPTPKVTCVLGDVGSTHTMVLFGDSKAWQWIPALRTVATERHWKLIVFTKGDCPVEDFVASTEPLTHCAQWRDQVFQRLATMHPALVIMSSYTREFVPQMSLTPRALSMTIGRLRSDGSAVVWLEDTPYPGFDVPDCLSAHPTDVQLCSFTVASGLSTPTVRDYLDREAQRAGATLIDPLAWMCTTKVCPPVIANTVVYFDAVHISSTYARRLAPELSTAVAGAMAEAKRGLS